jgi:hypothetical protein
LRRECKAISDKIEGILRAIEDGMYAPPLKERMAALEARRSELDQELNVATPPSPVRLHPGLSRVYRKKVQQLKTALNDDSMLKPLRYCAA